MVLLQENDKGMKVCMITSLHSPQDDRVFFKEALSLKSNGFDVSILCLADENGFLKDMSGNLLNEKNQQSIIIDGINIFGIKKQSTLFQKLLHKIGQGKCWDVFIKTAIDIDAEVYHAHEPQTAFIGLKIQKQTNAKLIYDAHEPWIFSRSIKEWVLKKLCLKKLKNIITANAITQQTLLKENPNINIAVIFNCSPSFFSQYRKENSEIIICHEGALLFNRGLKMIMEALIILKETHPNFKFKIIGDVFGKEKKYLRSKITANNLEENIEITGWLPYKNVPNAIAECSIGLICNTDEKRNTLAGPPNKLFNYMTMGLATITVDLPATTSILQKAKCGILLQKRDARHLSSSITKLLDDQDTLRTYQQSALQTADESYNWQSEAEQLFQFYKCLK
ncbi:MAG: glycosyltransferase [Bacteroidota bacterium]|nr:glycosyltransferase [Bacteroidota bacterium]